LFLAGQKNQLCNDLFDIGAVKFGLFTLKSGLKSPIYIDLRVLVSYPNTLKKVAKLLAKSSAELNYDRIAGIPYAAIAIATAFSLSTGKPMIYPRKEAKDYGTARQIEGVFNAGETILVIDDLITTGASKLETIAPLEQVGLKVKDICVLVDREQGGKKELEEKGYALHSVLTISELLKNLKKSGKISEEQFRELRSYFKNPEKWQEGK